MGLAETDLPLLLQAHRLPDNGWGLLLFVGKHGVVTFAIGLLFALREEIGWRGLMVPLMVRAGLQLPLLWSGLVWALWHAPLILWADYASSSTPWLSLLLFGAMVTGAAVVFGYTRLATASLWPAVVLHASHNAYFQGVFDTITWPGRWSDWLVGEAGLFPALVYLGLAGWLYASGRVRRAEQPWREPSMPS